MKKSQLALLAAGAVTSMFMSSSVFAADQAVPVAEVKAEAKADAKAEAKPVDKWAFLPEVVAEMDGKKYTKEEIVKLVDAQLANSPMAAMITPETLQQIVPRMINSMVETDILLKIATAAGITPSAQLVKDSFNEMLSKADKKEVEGFKQKLAAQNKTLEGYIDEMSKNKQFQDQAAIQAWINKDIIAKIKVDPKQVEEFYEKNKAEFAMPEKVSASHILISPEKEGDEAKKVAKEKAEKILADIKAGKVKFEDAATKESACPSGKKGGSLGAFSKNDMVPAFSQAAFALNKGELSGVVETPYGFHIIRCDDKIPEQQLTLADAKVKNYIEETLKGESIQKNVMEQLEAEKKKLNVKIFVKAPEMPVPPAKK